MSGFSIEWVEDEVKEVGPGVWIRVAVDNKFAGRLSLHDLDTTNMF